MRNGWGHLLRCCLAGLFLLAGPALAQEDRLATLVADSVSFDGRDKVRASGHVEIFYDGQRLLAEELIYDQARDELQLFGPITLIDATGQIFTARYGELSGDLRNGIMQSARVVIEEQMQVAAAEIQRVGGRYTQLHKTVASSCKVCAGSPTPLWQIRAERVIHDQQERQLYFENARFEVAGLPILWTPRLRLPDPTLRRASGFLYPTLRQNSALGFGVRLPYFKTIGDHADILLTPYLAQNTTTLEGRYRQAFRFGRVEFEGALSRDDIVPDETRAYLFGRGEFYLPGDFTLNLGVQLVSDPGYLDTYDFSDDDRLTNELELTRTRRNEYVSLRLSSLRTLRDNEIPIEDTLATNLVRGSYDLRMPDVWGGEARVLFDIMGYEREADEVDAALAASCVTVEAAECLARDVFRSTAELGWYRNWLLRNGMIARVEGEIAGDFYIVGQDPNLDTELVRVTPTAAMELRWPLARTAANGGRDVLEPMVQVAWSESYGDDTVPNEDSTLVEFDEGNLLALSRFPGRDVRETGLRTAVGLAWTHYTPSGQEYAVSVGKIFRATDPDLFSTSSGLDGTVSDWLVAGRVEIAERLSLSNRSLFDNGFDFTKSETRLSYLGQRLTAGASYIWSVAAPSVGRTEDISEWELDMAYRFDRHWTGKASWRYDLISGSAAEAGLGLEYNNECVSIDLSLSRSFTSSTNVEPTTDVGLTVALNGFGSDGRAYARSCTM
ncbi:LPS-assembly protein LptD [Pseudoruegeria sp. HB172150]|uniref:LPS-assembly protein LptD n=1 Tax=Pseudoruegeria sp. HB172150 TaxID=2721164 RepID=UPI001554DD62|nr:LPS assembly protein LptD [Pseudoruegeria sp. HB172150]